MDDAVIEAIAEQVHIAWMLEKQRQGYADHPISIDGTGLVWKCRAVIEEHGGLRKCETPYEFHHTDMLPYAELADRIKEYDRVTARAVVAAIQEAGYRIVPAAHEEAAPTRQ